MNKNKFTYYYFAVALVLGILVACSGESEEENKSKTIEIEEISEPGEDTNHRELGDFDNSKEPFTEYSLKVFNQIKKKHKNALNFTSTQGGLLFLTQNKTEYFKENGDFDKSIRFGLVSEFGEVLLPNEYEMISNPGLVANHHVEFKKNSKYGLFNYASKQIIPAEYDVIFPSPIMEYVAIGVKNDRYYKIYPDGKSKEFKQNQQVISYTQLIKSHPLDYGSNHFGIWYETSAFENFGEDYFMDYTKTRTIISASYFAQLDVYTTFNRDYYVMEDSLSLNLSAMRKLPNGNFGFISSLYHSIMDGRGYEQTFQKLHIVSKTNKSIKNILLTDDNDTYEMNGYSDRKIASKFINDSVVQVRNFARNDGAAIPYTYYTIYDFYSILRSNKIKKYDKGIFPMTEAIELSADYFKGNFIRFVEDENEKMKNPDYDIESEGVAVICTTNHLTATDLRYMLNEIYARHGLKFKNPALSELFKTFKWYKPTFTEVDSKLSEIEKRNIALILKMEKELKSSPNKYIKPTYSYYAMAG